MRGDPFPTGPLVEEALVSWPAQFGRSAPLEVEIGFGYGHFLLGYALAHPGVDLVGIEMKTKLAAKVSRHAERRGLENVLALHGDSRRLLPTLFALHTVRAFHIQFPDPWWKKRHHRRRLVEPALVDLLFSLLEPEGRVYLRTDILDYARVMIDTFEDGRGRFRNLEAPKAFVADDGLGVPSNRERRYLQSGTPVYRLMYRVVDVSELK